MYITLRLSLETSKFCHYEPVSGLDQSCGRNVTNAHRDSVIPTTPSYPKETVYDMVQVLDTSHFLLEFIGYFSCPVLNKIPTVKEIYVT